MPPLRPFALLFVVALCPGCASIVSGTNQSLSVVTTTAIGVDIEGARCALVNDKGSWYATTPGSVTVHRSYSDLSVNCTKEGLEPGSSVVKSSTKGMAAGNILFGGIIGAGVDVSSGAAYDYPNLITVTMGGQTTRSTAPSLDGAAVAQTPVADGPLPVPTVAAKQAVVSVGSRLTFQETDPWSGGKLGESTYAISGMESSEIAFNDGTIVTALDGSPVRGSMPGATIYGAGPQQIARGGTWSGRFRAPSVLADVPVQITLMGRQAKVVSGRTFQAAKLGVEGYASRDVSASGTGERAGASFKGEMLVDAETGLILEIKVISRHPRYSVQRELIRISGT